MQESFTLGNMKLNTQEFINKIQNYDIEFTRKDILTALSNVKPTLKNEILSAVKQTYHINMGI